MMISNGEAAGRRPAPSGYEGMGHREADHRIANSLQLLSSLLSAQGRDTTDPDARAAIETSVQRIGAIAGVHRHLYGSHGANGVDLRAYLMDLLSGLRGSFSCENRDIHLEAEPVAAPSDFASIIGIIVTEIVINACKHAYAPDQPGPIEIVLSSDAERRFTLEVRDRGRGRSDDRQSGQRLGSRIVDLMSRKLNADARYVPVAIGTAFVMTGELPAA